MLNSASCTYTANVISHNFAFFGFQVSLWDAEVCFAASGRDRHSATPNSPRPAPPPLTQNDSSNGPDSHPSYHWQPAVDLVQVDEDGDVPRAQVQGMDVGVFLALAVLHPQRGPAEAGGGGGGQHGTGHGLLEVREHVVLAKVVFLW